MAGEETNLPSSTEEEFAAELDRTGGEGDAPGAQDPASSAPPADATSPGELEQPQAQSQEESPWWEQSAREFGFENVRDEEDFRARWSEDYRLLRQREHELGQRLAQAEYLAQQYLAAQQQPQQQQPASETPSPSHQASAAQSWWNPPEADERLAARYLQTDPQTGQTEWRPGAPLELRQRYEQRQAYLEDWARSLLYDPPKAAQKFWEGEIRPQIEQLLNEREARQAEAIQRQSAEQTALAIQQQYADLLYARDPRTGQVQVDPYTNSPVPSQHGRLIADSLQLVDRARAGDPTARFHVASLMALGRLYAQGAAAPGAAPGAVPSAAPAPASPAPAPHDPRAAHRRQMAAGAGRAPARDAVATAHSRGQDPNPHLRFEEQLEADLTADGYTGPLLVS